MTQRFGGIFSALNNRDISLIQQFESWALSGLAGGLTDYQMEVIEKFQLGPGLQGADLDEVSESLGIYIDVLSVTKDPGFYDEGFETNPDFRFRTDFSGGEGSPQDIIRYKRVQSKETGRIRTDPQVEIDYGRHKRWSSALAQIKRKVDKLIYRLENGDLD